MTWPLYTVDATVFANATTFVLTRYLDNQLAATACAEAIRVIDAAETTSKQQATARADTATIAKTFADARDGLQKIESESSDAEMAKRIGQVRGSYNLLLNQATGDGNFALPLAMVKQTVQDLRDHCKSKR